MKHLLIVIYLCVITLIAKAQNINGVSTNPENPVNPPLLPWANTHLGTGFTYDPFLNRFDWRPVDLNGNLTDFIPIEYNTGFNIAGISLSNNQIPMKNPFNTGMSGGASSYIGEVLRPSVRDRDFRWEDGWELLWMNLGYTPSLQLIDLPDSANPLDITGPSPTHAPYFVLYNRYKGTMRLFSNVWFNTTTANKPQKVIATLMFNNEKVNGLLRHNSSYDLALDRPTIIKNISGPSYNFQNQFSWMMSDFQVGFDPCICNRTTNNTRLNFEFRTMQTMNIDMTSRSIAVNKPITDNSYLRDDFLNLGDVDFTNPNDNKPGSRMYKEMGSMLDAYKAAQLQYEKDLANYNSTDGILKRAALDILKDGITATGSMVGAGVAGSFFTNGSMRNFILKNKTRVGLFSGGLIALDTNDADAFAKSVTGATKSIIASGFDFLSTTFDVPDKPIKPSPPTATFTETTYKGTITADSRFPSDNLLIPGSLPNSFANGSPGINRLNYPAYNEVLGLFALLETPEFDIEKQKIGGSLISYNIGDIMVTNVDLAKIKGKNNYCIKLNKKLNYRFNHVVDFNFEKTKLYYSFRIKLKSSKITTNNGFELNQSITDRLLSITNNNFMSESYTVQNNPNSKVLIINTPFVLVKNMLNEPTCFETEQFIDLFFIKNPEYPAMPDFFAQNITNIDPDIIESIELKLMADMYFHSLGSKDQEINTLQTFTYLIYQNSGSDNQMPIDEDKTYDYVTFLNQNKSLLKHQPGNTLFDNVHFSPSTINQFKHSSVIGNEIHVWVENAELKNNITVSQGYKAFIHFLGILNVSPTAEISPEIILENIASETLYNYPFVIEATDAELKSFCEEKNNKYKANIALAKKEHIRQSRTVDSSQPLRICIYPNPSNSAFEVYTNAIGYYTITMIDITGRLVYTSEIVQYNKGIMDVSQLQNGIYFVQVTGNGQTTTQKIIVKH